MESPDVNVLVNAARDLAPHHGICRTWLETALAGRQTIAVSELVLSGVVRILTHPRVFDPPSSLAETLGFVDGLLAHPFVVRLRAGEAHWRIFRSLCEDSHATGNRVPDAYHAALAIEHGAVWVTLDGGFAAFPGLRARNLLAAHPDEVRESRPRYAVTRPRRRGAAR